MHGSEKPSGNSSKQEMRVPLYHSSEEIRNWQPKYIRPATTKTILYDLFVPDLTEMILFVLSVILAYAIFVPLVGIPPENPLMLNYVGIVGLMLYLSRWGYTSWFHMLARQQVLRDKAIKEGRTILDFKIFGIGLSFLLMLIGSML